MDPAEALRLAREAFREGRNVDADEHLQDYFSWRRSGGYQPRGGDKRARDLAERVDARLFEEDEEAQYISSRMGDEEEYGSWRRPRKGTFGLRGTRGLQDACDNALREAAANLRRAKTPAQRRAAQKFMKQVKSRCGLGRISLRRKR